MVDIRPSDGIKLVLAPSRFEIVPRIWMMHMGTKKLGADDKFKIYGSAKSGWRWRRVAPNGKIVGASTES
jgi:hypothetical protein